MQKHSHSRTSTSIHEEDHLPPYLQAWFQDIAAHAKHAPSRLTSFRTDYKNPAVGAGHIRGSQYRNKGGFLVMCDFPAAHVSDPVITSGDPATVTAKLIKQLPINASIHLILSHRASYQAFIDNGFQHMEEVNYRILLHSEKVWWESLDTKVRTKFRKGEKELEVRPMTAEHFVRFYAQNLKDQGRRVSVNTNFDVIHKILVEGERRDQARAIMACNKGYDEPIAANATLWSQEGYYNWLTSYRRTDSRRRLRLYHGVSDKEAIPDNPANKPNRHAVRFLMLNGIRHAFSKSIPYDLDGAYTSEAKNFYSEFGGTLMLKHTVRRRTFGYKMWEEAVYLGRSIVKKTLGSNAPA